MNRKRFGVLLGIYWVCASRADIYQWNQTISDQNPRPYVIDTEENSVTIIAGATNPNQIFSFEAFDANGDPADIDKIEVAQGVTGLIRVQVLPDPNSTRTHGARSIRVIDLSNAGTGQLASLNLSGNLGSTAWNNTGYLFADSITGGTRDSFCAQLSFGAAARPTLRERSEYALRYGRGFPRAAR